MAGIKLEDRMVRLLGVVAYLDAHGEASVAELAELFGARESDILKDIDTLWVTGLPGYFPDDLIDFDGDAMDRGIIRVTQAHGLEHQLRLGMREAVALTAAVRALMGTTRLETEQAGTASGTRAPEVTSSSKSSPVSNVLRSTLEQLVAAAGIQSEALSVDLELHGDPKTLARIEEARAGALQLAMTYTDLNDNTKRRIVEPISVDVSEEHTMLSAFCVDVQGLRTYRVDRIQDAEVLLTAAKHRDVQDQSSFADVITEVDHVVELRLRSTALPVMEGIPYESLTHHDDGTFSVELRVSNHRWLEQLVLSHAPAVVEAPAEIASSVRQHARFALAAYEQTTSGYPAA